MFAGGVNRTKYPILCQAVSVVRVLVLLQDVKCVSALLPNGKYAITVLFIKIHWFVQTRLPYRGLSPS